MTLINGAPDRNRTCDLSLHPTSAFAAGYCTPTAYKTVRGLDYALTIDRFKQAVLQRPEPSSLYTFPSLGLARRCHKSPGKAFYRVHRI